MSAFFLYSQANRPRVKEENPEAAFGEIVSRVSTRVLIALLLESVWAEVLHGAKFGISMVYTSPWWYYTTYDVRD
jgi:hypothetical protein